MNQLIRYGADERRFDEAKDFPGLFLARVISPSLGLYRIVTEEAECLAALSGKLRREADDPALLPTVGDYVMVDRCSDEGGNAIIHAVLSRRSVFTRAAVGSAHGTQVIAANIDYAFLCMSLNSNYSLARLERYLSVAYASGAIPIVILTKGDLCEDVPEKLANAQRIAPGADVIVTDEDSPQALETLRAYLKEGVTASFIGSSGVGKSTLINRLIGAERMDTSSIRGDGKGRHTTTRRELILLPDGGIVIDTPGMRELGAENVDLQKSFSDIDALASQCRFADCTHKSEPGCAVQKAIAEGTLDPRRLESYVKLKREAKYNGLGSKALESEKYNAMFAGVGGMKNVRKYLRQTDKRKY